MGFSGGREKLGSMLLLGRRTPVMEQLQSAKPVVRQLLIWTLVGFLVVTLAGPAIALVGALLPFAIVGGLVWLAYKALTLGPKVALQMMGATVRSLAAVILFLPKQALNLGGWVLARVESLLGLGLRMAGPVALGAIAGGALGYAGGVQYHDVAIRLPLGVAMGAGIGLLAFAVRSSPAKKQIVVAAEPMNSLPPV